MKKVLLTILVLSLIVSTVACTGPGSGSTQSTEKVGVEASSSSAAVKEAKDITIAVVPQQLGNPVFLPAKEAAEAMGKELGIKIEWVA